MRKLLQLISLVALVLTVLPSALYLAAKIDLDQTKWSMLVATIVWFVATPLWMGQKDRARSASNDATNETII